MLQHFSKSVIVNLIAYQNIDLCEYSASQKLSTRLAQFCVAGDKLFLPYSMEHQQYCAPLVMKISGSFTSIEKNEQ